jgi:hypothetical protein
VYAEPNQAEAVDEEIDAQAGDQRELPKGAGTAGQCAGNGHFSKTH